MSAAIDFGLEFDDSCFVEDMTDSPTLADLAEECCNSIHLDFFKLCSVSKSDKIAQHKPCKFTSQSSSFGFSEIIFDIGVPTVT